MDVEREHKIILDKIRELYTEIFLHNGFGEIKIEMKFLKKKQKEIIIRCGKDFRYVVDYDNARNALDAGNGTGQFRKAGQAV